MNKYQKAKSREIRDIMRKLRKVTYKEAKRRWKDGFRALPTGVIDREASKRGVIFTYRYAPRWDAYDVRFRKKLSAGTEFEFSVEVSVEAVRSYRGNRVDLVNAIMRELDAGMRSLGVDIPENCPCEGWRQ